MNKNNKYWYDRLNDKSRKEELQKDIWMFIKLIIWISSLSFLVWFFIGCSEHQDNPIMNQKEIRHDPAPQNMHGEWVSVMNNKDVIVTVTAGVVYFNLNRYNKGTFEIYVNDFEAIASSERLYTMKYAGMTIHLSTGTGEYAESVTLTIDNDCITRMIRYVPAATQPEPTEPEPVEEPTPIFN